MRFTLSSGLRTRKENDRMRGNLVISSTSRPDEELTALLKVSKLFTNALQISYNIIVVVNLYNEINFTVRLSDLASSCLNRN